MGEDNNKKKKNPLKRKLSLSKSGMRPNALLKFFKVAKVERGNQSDEAVPSEPGPSVLAESRNRNDCVITPSSDDIITLSSDEEEESEGDKNPVNNAVYKIEEIEGVNLTNTVAALRLNSLLNTETEVIDLTLDDEFERIAPGYEENGTQLLQQIPPENLTIQKSSQQEILSTVSVESDTETTFSDNAATSVPAFDSNNINARMEVLDPDACLYEFGHENVNPFSEENLRLHANRMPNAIESRILVARALNEVAELPNIPLSTELVSVVREEFTKQEISSLKALSSYDYAMEDSDEKSESLLRDATKTIYDAIPLGTPKGEWVDNDVIWRDNISEKRPNHMWSESFETENLECSDLEARSYLEHIANRSNLSPLRTTTNTDVHRFDPKKRKEKVQYCLTRTPESWPVIVEEDENSENVPIITGSYSVSAQRALFPDDGNSLANREPRSSFVQTNNCSSEERNKNYFLNTDKKESPLVSDHIRNSSIPKDHPVAAKPTSDVKGEAENEVETFLSKKLFSRAVESMLKHLVQKDNTPKEIHLVEATTYILNGKRVPKEVKSSVAKIWEHLLATKPVNLEMRNYFARVLLRIEITSEDRAELRIDVPEGYSDVLILLKKAVLEESEVSPKQRPILKLLEIITSIIIQEYKNVYAKQNVKRLPPLILELLNNSEACSIQYHFHQKHLLRELFSLYCYKEPFYCVLDMVTCLADHFHKYPRNGITIISDICEHLRESKYTAWSQIISKMSATFGLKVCEEFLKSIVFSTERYPSQKSSPEDEKQDKDALWKFMTGFSKIVQVGLNYEKEFADSYIEPASTGNLNLRGEKNLHILVKNKNVEGLESYLSKIRQEKLGTVNEVDNGRNTAYHDAVFKAPSEILVAFQKHNLIVLDDSTIPNSVSTNLLAQNAQGNTLLHLLAHRDDLSKIVLIIYLLKGIYSKMGLLPLCRMMRNNEGKTPYDMASKSHPIVRAMLRPSPSLTQDFNLSPGSRQQILTDPRFLDLAKLWYLFTFNSQ